MWLPPSGRTPPNSAGWPPSATCGSGRTQENHGGAAESHRFHGGMGDIASSASGGSEVDVDVVQGRRGAGHRLDPPSGTSSARCSLHGAPQIRCSSAAGWAIFSPTCLPSIGNLVLVGTTPRGDKIVTSEQSLVLACCLPGRTAQIDAVDPRCWVTTENGREVAISRVFTTRAAVGVRPARTWRLWCAACQSGDRVLGLYSRRLQPRLVASPVEAAHYRHGHLTTPFASCCMLTNCTRKPTRR
jgi:hypothetical protein